MGLCTVADVCNAAAVASTVKDDDMLLYFLSFAHAANCVEENFLED